MTASRQDAWTEEEDRLLTKTVLEHISSGSTQLKAFESVGIQLKRTAAACGFRWNSAVRKQHPEEIEKAKLERKERMRRRKRAGESPLDEKNEADRNMPDFKEALRLIRRLEQIVSHADSLKIERDRLKEENKNLSEERDRVKHEHYSLLALLDKARNQIDSQ